MGRWLLLQHQQLLLWRRRLLRTSHRDEFSSLSSPVWSGCDRVTSLRSWSSLLRHSAAAPAPPPPPPPPPQPPPPSPPTDTEASFIHSSANASSAAYSRCAAVSGLCMPTHRAAQLNLLFCVYCVEKERKKEKKAFKAVLLFFLAFFPVERKQ
jgi:hypothetical protein